MDLFADFEARARAALAGSSGLAGLRIVASPPRSGGRPGVDVVVALSGTGFAGSEAREVAALLARRLAPDPDIAAVTAGAASVDLVLRPRRLGSVLVSALRDGDAYGRGTGGTPATVVVQGGAPGFTDGDGGAGPDRPAIVAQAIVALLAFAGRPSALVAARGSGPNRDGGAWIEVIDGPARFPSDGGAGRSLRIDVKPARLAGGAEPRDGGREGWRRDALRFALLSQRSDRAVALDSPAAADRSFAAPLFDVSYAKARAARIIRGARGDRPGADLSPAALASADVALLVDPGERALIRAIAAFPRVAAVAAERGEPHRVARLLRDLAGAVHHQWNRSKDQPQLRFVNEEQRDLTQARLGLMTACTLVLTSGLAIFGIEAPDEMR